MRKILIAAVIVLSGCATGPAGPRLYDNAVIVINSENALLLQQQIDHNFMRIVNIRMNEFAADAIAAYGDLKVVPACGPRTMKIMQDVQSLSITNLVEISPGFWSTKSKKKDNVRALVGTTVTDCETGVRLGKIANSEDGQDPFAVLRKLVRENISDAYDYQNGPRPKPIPSAN